MATITTPLAADEAIADLVTTEARRRSMAAHPCCGDRSRASSSTAIPGPADEHLGDVHTGDSESGSMATEYGLIAVVAAFICSLMIKWASGGGVFDILSTIVGRIADFLF